VGRESDQKSNSNDGDTQSLMPDGETPLPYKHSRVCEPWRREDHGGCYEEEHQDHHNQSSANPTADFCQFGLTNHVRPRKEESNSTEKGGHAPAQWGSQGTPSMHKPGDKEENKLPNSKQEEMPENTLGGI